MPTSNAIGVKGKGIARRNAPRKRNTWNPKERVNVQKAPREKAARENERTKEKASRAKARQIGVRAMTVDSKVKDRVPIT